jgi:4-amino-4-deoxy-L-arabinose transferase-like glycosyltransferase
MSSLLKLQLSLAMVAVLVFFTNLGVPKLWDEDEPRNAACAREMHKRGDWVVPTFNDELRTQKPVLLYWLMMASYSVFGANEFAARLPSALLAVGTTLVTFHLGRLLFSPRVGLMAGLMMATCLMFGVAGRAATPDSCLIFFTALSMCLYVRSVMPPLPLGEGRGEGVSGASSGLSTHLRGDFLPQCWLDFALVYAAMALAVLAKGPIGLVLPVAIIGLFLLLVQRGLVVKVADFCIRFLRTAWSMRPLTIVLVVGLIAAPWYVLVGLRTDGQWTRAFFGSENLARFQNAMEGHSGPIFYYIPAILIGFFPWSIVLPASVWFAVRDGLGPLRHPSYLLLVCWAGVWIAAFSLAGTKLPSYVLPAYPALALMAAAFVDRWLDQPACVPRWLMHVAWASLAAVGVGMIVGLPMAAARHLPGEEAIGLVGIVPLLGGLAAIVLHYRRHPAAAIGAVSLTAVVLCVGLFSGVAVRVSRHQNTSELIEVAREYAGDTAKLATFAHPESSVVYYAGSRVERCQQPAEASNFVIENPGALLITNTDRWEELKSHLPPDVAVIARQPRFLKEGEVLLLGRTISTAAARAAAHR